MAGYLMPQVADSQRIVHINDVDVVNRRASGMWSDGAECGPVIDTSRLVGGVQITPSPGEVWMVERSGMLYFLVRPVARTAALSGITKPEVGQQQIGGQGPLELLGSTLNAHAPINLQSVSERPDAVTAGEGAMVYDPAIKKPIVSDGAIWRDVMGNAV